MLYSSSDYLWIYMLLKIKPLKFFLACCLGAQFKKQLGRQFLEFTNANYGEKCKFRKKGNRQELSTYSFQTMYIIYINNSSFEYLGGRYYIQVYTFAARSITKKNLLNM